jgi:hypothetical protein
MRMNDNGQFGGQRSTPKQQGINLQILTFKVGADPWLTDRAFRERFDESDWNFIAVRVRTCG